MYLSTVTPLPTFERGNGEDLEPTSAASAGGAAQALQLDIQRRVRGDDEP
jgi:hypothetical protein